MQSHHSLIPVHHSSFSRFQIVASFLILSLILLAGSASATPPQINLSSNGAPLTQLVVGDHLEAEVVGLDPGVQYVVTLKNELGLAVTKFPTVEHVAARCDLRA